MTSTSSPPLARNRDELILALRIIMGEMQRVPVLKHWYDAKRKKQISVGQPLISIFEDACGDSSMLAVRALDEFFRTRRAAPKGHSHLKTARKDDLFAEEFGYKDDKPLLSESRRADINQLMGHLTWRRVHETLESDLRADLVCVIGHSVRFLAWLIKTKFLKDEEPVTAEVNSLMVEMQSAADDPFWGGNLELIMPESIMKATAIAVSDSPFAATFKLWRTSASRSSPAAGHGGCKDDIMKFPADVSDLKSLVCVLDALCTRLGIKVSYEGHSLGDIGVRWKKLHNTVVEHLK